MIYLMHLWLFTNNILDAKIIYKELINKSGISRSINNNDLDGWKFYLTQSYLTLQGLFYTLKRPTGTVKLVLSKSTDLSSESIVTPTTTNNSLSPSTKWY